MIKTIALQGLEKAINHYLQLDANIEKTMAPLNSKVVGIHLTDLSEHFYMSFNEKTVYLQKICNKTADLTISSDLMTFASMAMKKTQQLPDGMEISGNAVLAQQLQQFLANINIDWEEHLSHYTGDVVANQLGRFAKKAGHFAKHMISTLQLNTKEYLQEEAGHLPHNNQVEAFNKDVDELRHAIARASSKLKHLKQQSSS